MATSDQGWGETYEDKIERLEAENRQLRGEVKGRDELLEHVLAGEYRAEIKRLREALQALLDFPGGMYAPALERKAREALGQKP